LYSELRLEDIKVETSFVKNKTMKSHPTGMFSLILSLFAEY